MRARGWAFVQAAVLATGCHLVFPHAPMDSGQHPAGLEPGRAPEAKVTLDRQATRDLPPGCLLGQSCKEIHERCPSAPTGTYAVDPDGDGVTFQVHCEMAIDDGGWTLAGRSAGTLHVESFGWRADTGALPNDTAPYSIDLLSRLYPFTQVLVGSRAAGKSFGANVYRFGVPPDFASSYATTGVAMQGIAAVKGSCVPNLQNQSMLHYLGCTEDRGWFFLRDHAECENFGLMANGFSIAAGVSGVSSCDRWGELRFQHGMIFVR